MINDVYVIDDVIPVELQDSIEDLLLGDKLGWHFAQDLTRMRKQIKEENLTDLSPYFWISFYEHQNDQNNGMLTRKLHPILDGACEKLKLPFAKLLQGRTFMLFPLVEELRKKYVNIHVDTQTEHVVCLYYVNDADGDTVLFDKTANEVSPFESHNNKVNFKEVQRVSPKKGRCLVFNGDKYHSATSPAKYTRCVVNFNFLIR
jgi:hypothetical protein